MVKNTFVHCEVGVQSTLQVRLKIVVDLKLDFNSSTTKFDLKWLNQLGDEKFELIGGRLLQREGGGCRFVHLAVDLVILQLRGGQHVHAF